MINDSIMFFLGVFIGFVLALWVVSNDARIVGVEQAIEQCEAELPRHQHCEYVITARVVE